MAEVSRYIREASGERIREKGELYLRQGAVIAGLAPAEEKISTTTALIPESVDEETEVVGTLGTEEEEK